MDKSFFPESYSPYILTPYNVGQTSGLKSYIRNITPDYHLEIKLFASQIETYEYESFAFAEITDTHYDLNYGDLFLLLVNSFNGSEDIVNTIIELMGKIHFYKNELMSFIPDQIRKYKTNNRKGPILLSAPHLLEIHSNITRYSNALALCLAISQLIDKDRQNDYLFLTFLSCVFGEGKQKATYTSDDLRFNISHKTTFLSDISLTMHFEDFGICEYYFKSLSDLALFDMYEALKRNVTVKTCENCGALFIPSSRSDEKYCDYHKIGGKSCKHVGYDNKVGSSDILKTYRTIYKTQNARKNRNKGNILTIEDRFRKWAFFAKQQLKLCQDGKITIDDLRESISGNEWIES